MKPGNDIRYLRNHEIDKLRWDQCIDNADNGRIYAYSFYLDHMSRQWDALVLNDYEYVMPLPWNSKFGIRYIYQPFLAAQLGVFGGAKAAELAGRFIASLPRSFKLVELSLNSSNLSGFSPAGIVKRNNFLLRLDKSYEELYTNYSENNRRNIKKALQAGCTVQNDTDVEQIIQLALAGIKDKDRRITDNANRFRNLYRELHERKMTATLGISGEGLLLASCVFFFSHHRAYYILVGNDPRSRTIGASHALLDGFIKEHAGKQLVLDFEGSDLPGLVSFYQGFGAFNEPYPFLRINRLPFFLRWMK